MTGNGSRPPSMTIACVIHSLDGGGAERVMAGLSSRLALRGHRVHLITYDDAANDRHRVDESVLRHPLAIQSRAKGLVGKTVQIRERLNVLRRAIKQCQPDVVLSFCDRTNLDVLLALGKKPLPIVVSERSDPSQQSLGVIWSRARKILYQRATNVIALTEHAADYLRSFSKAVTVIPSAVAEPTCFSDRAVACRENLIIGVGRFEEEKGFDLLIDSFSKLLSKHSSWRLALFGKGRLLEALQSQSHALGISDRVAFPGWKQPLDIEIQNATIFCLPSRYEGFPSALLEAMSMGIPSISVNCESGPGAIIAHEENGLLVERNVDALTNGIRRLIEHAELRERLGDAGREVVQRFGWDSMTDHYERVLFESLPK